MKMVKSLLLGSAAGLVAVAGAQAADLPVKAKPVEYVKVCSLYGAGYYYIPGTDVCVKIGGYVRADWSYKVENPTNGPFAATAGHQTRIAGAQDTAWRSRAYINMDTRQQTAYGTLRTYFQVGINHLYSAGGGATFNSNRAFIQIAGFTAGLASSYFDFYSVAAVGYLTDESSDTGDGGRAVFAYTAQLGNGLSATLSLEEPSAKDTGVSNTSTGAPTLGSKYNNNKAKNISPDIVANLRVSQAWGGAQLMGALRQVNGGYYGTTLTGAEVNGHPSDKWGWAVGAGLRINTPMIAPGDYLQAQVAYAQGATRYVSNTKGNFSPAAFGKDGTVGYGIHSDGIFRGATAAAANATGVELTTAWGVSASYEHFWTPSLRTSVHGSYVAVKYSATANDALCGNLPSGITLNAANTVTCNNDFQTWNIGSRTQWNVTRDFYMGFDVVYYKLQTANKGAIVNVAAQSSAQGAGVYTVADQDAIVGMVRWHRDIAP